MAASITTFVCGVKPELETTILHGNSTVPAMDVVADHLKNFFKFSINQVIFACNYKINVWNLSMFHLKGSHLLLI